MFYIGFTCFGSRCVLCFYEVCCPWLQGYRIEASRRRDEAQRCEKQMWVSGWIRVKSYNCESKRHVDGDDAPNNHKCWLFALLTGGGSYHIDES